MNSFFQKSETIIRILFIVIFVIFLIIANFADLSRDIILQTSLTIMALMFVTVGIFYLIKNDKAEGLVNLIGGSIMLILLGYFIFL
ncbi:hypothetical protein ACI2JA_02695 [Alkalihalobacillus sp. NPDC078783]